MIRLGVNRLHREKGHKGGANAKDINIFVAQYVNTQKLDKAKINLGAAYYLYDGVKGSTTPYDSVEKVIQLMVMIFTQRIMESQKVLLN